MNSSKVEFQVGPECGKKKESAVLEANLATAQFELSLSLGWAKVDQYQL